MNGIVQWLKLAMRPNVVRRAVRTAVIVGSILTAINHGEEIISGTLTRYGLGQICLTLMVPYIVSTSSSVATLRETARTAGNVEPADTKPASESGQIVAR